MKEKITLYITDIAFHNREFREAETLESTTKKSDGNIERGRIYMNKSISRNENGKVELTLKLPNDLQRRVDAEEVEVEYFVPKDGIPMFLGVDAEKKVKQVRKAARLKLARSGQVWKKE